MTSAGSDLSPYKYTSTDSDENRSTACSAHRTAPMAAVDAVLLPQERKHNFVHADKLALVDAVIQRQLAAVAGPHKNDAIATIASTRIILPRSLKHLLHFRVTETASHPYLALLDEERRAAAAESIVTEWQKSAEITLARIAPDLTETAPMRLNGFEASHAAVGGDTVLTLVLSRDWLMQNCAVFGFLVARIRVTVAETPVREYYIPFVHHRFIMERNNAQTRQIEWGVLPRESIRTDTEMEQYDRVRLAQRQVASVREPAAAPPPPTADDNDNDVVVVRRTNSRNRAERRRAIRATAAAAEEEEEDDEPLVAQPAVPPPPPMRMVDLMPIRYTRTNTSSVHQRRLLVANNHIQHNLRLSGIFSDVDPQTTVVDAQPGPTRASLHGFKLQFRAFVTEKPPYVFRASTAWKRAGPIIRAATIPSVESHYTLAGIEKDGTATDVIEIATRPVIMGHPNSSERKIDEKDVKLVLPLDWVRRHIRPSSFFLMRLRIMEGTEILRDYYIPLVDSEALVKGEDRHARALYWNSQAPPSHPPEHALPRPVPRRRRQYPSTEEDVPLSDLLSQLEEMASYQLGPAAVAAAPPRVPPPRSPPRSPPPPPPPPASPVRVPPSNEWRPSVSVPSPRPMGMDEDYANDGVPAPYDEHYAAAPAPAPEAEEADEVPPAWTPYRAGRPSAAAPAPFASYTDEDLMDFLFDAGHGDKRQADASPGVSPGGYRRELQRPRRMSLQLAQVPLPDAPPPALPPGAMSPMHTDAVYADAHGIGMIGSLAVDPDTDYWPDLLNR